MVSLSPADLQVSMLKLLLRSEIAWSFCNFTLCFLNLNIHLLVLTFSADLEALAIAIFYEVLVDACDLAVLERTDEIRVIAQTIVGVV